MKSEIEVLMSQISTNISEVYVKMSEVDAEAKSSCLSAVSKILHQLGCLVATKLSSSDISIKSNSYQLYYDDEETVLSMSEDEETVLSTSEDKESVQSMSEGKMISNLQSKDEFSKLLSTISSVAPSLIYDRRKAMRKRRKRSNKKICPELLSIWSNAATIVSPATSSTQSATSYFPTYDYSGIELICTYQLVLRQLAILV